MLTIHVFLRNLPALQSPPYLFFFSLMLLASTNSFKDIWKQNKWYPMFSVWNLDSSQKDKSSNKNQNERVESWPKLWVFSTILFGSAGLEENSPLARAFICCNWGILFGGHPQREIAHGKNRFPTDSTQDWFEATGTAYIPDNHALKWQLGDKEWKFAEQILF